MELNTVVSPPARVGLPAIRLKIASDERLARLVARGDDTAFSLIYERYHQALYRYCRSLVRHEADAQDALQSALASAFSALSRGQRDAPLRPWLFRIAHNESISLLRRRRPQDELPELASGQASLEEHVQKKEQLALLVADLQELPERQRGALVMRELSGLSHEEIAQALGTSVNAAKQSIFEARRSLVEFEEGRAMACDDVCRLVSDADRRLLRSRRVRAHLRQCSACSTFAAAIPERSLELRAIAPPLPAFAAANILARVLGSGSAHGGDGAGILAAGAGKAVGTAVATKVTAVAVAATTTVGVAVALRQRMPPVPGQRDAPAAAVHSRAAGPGSVATGYTAANALTGASARSRVSSGSTGAGKLAGAARRTGVASTWSTTSLGGLALAHGHGKQLTAAGGKSAGGSASSNATQKAAGHAGSVSSRGATTANRNRSGKPSRRSNHHRSASGVARHRVKLPPPLDPTTGTSSVPLSAGTSLSRTR